MNNNNKKTLQLCSQGRRPWYHPDGSIADPYLIGIAGGSASGKTSVAERVLKNLNVPWVVIVSMDSFYNILTPEQSKLAHQSLFNFDHPSAFDYDLLYDTLKKLKEGKSVTVPIYNFSTHSREEKTVTIYGANVIIFEGILALYDKRIRDMMDVKIFVDTDADIQLARRLQRDTTYRGRDVEGILDQYTRYVKPSYDSYVRPTMKFADVIIPRGLENVIAIDLMTKHIQTQLNENVINFRWNLLDTPVKEEVPSNVHVLPTTNQIKGIHTILRDHNTERDEFVFYADRLAVLLMEYAINLLPSEPLTVTTPIGAKYEGLRYSQKICGVSILRAGGTMEAGLKRVFSDAVIGKLLIQTNPNTGDPELHYCKLPNSARDHNVVLMDAMVGTGAAALMAIRVLLDHEVPEDRIIFVSFLAAQIGLTVINNAFPRVKIVTSMVDPDLNKEKLWIVPGIGNFGDRYFGTEEDEE
ncbi:uridine-cytidine kinase 1-like 1 [Rhizopus microsporus ATCC 52813]|uniref:Uridine kinase n=1 Tax=Rhizopus microsporus ATCC 52813 TaxID=1340429 RepID=A0A2G4SF40_RHIZD|nr:uridine-cytidine kinase 1-like 1 [Rhizopus microsporus ATCC 52813]PHZ07401.1 uridine-cytidine kinase 1-like 1 [Rhizopus microsporus ATCC 52813]